MTLNIHNVKYNVGFIYTVQHIKKISKILSESRLSYSNSVHIDIFLTLFKLKC